MKNSSRFHAEKDLKLIAYLLASGLEYKGFQVTENGTVFCYFSPIKKATELVNAYFSRIAPAIQPQDLFESLENARNIVFRAKDEADLRRKNLGGDYEQSGH